ncbi:hypothetical protein GIB67_010994 [Kingdonia uniflora]|uniref:RRM domain-containing protein n=1 Tax=Kingdonia uniflora TaxID=39325 RepID=A0A7J7MPN5_9MAGN|nr:hypothetical protein GIB67_010994 [Kingdonia uniflora]
MPSEIMNQRSFSPSSYFFDEIRFPAERHVGFWNPETMPDHHGREQQPKFGVQPHVIGAERMSKMSVTSWGDHDLGARSNISVRQASYVLGNSKVNIESQYENNLFSSSLSDLFSKKMSLSSNDVLFGHSVDAVTASHYEEEEPFQSLEEIEAQTIGNLLPDEDDLLSGVIDGMEYFAQPHSGDDLEDFDLFSSGGGLELEGDDGLDSKNSSMVGEHPYGEHPSRTLFVRNINSNIEDSELKVLFEQFGDIRTLYTACKHRGFVMISYYDIRAARNAMRTLQNKPLRRRKLDIHYSIPKDNPSDKDINQGTLVVFNLDFSVSNEDLRQIFGVYGEIKEIRETPHKRHHKFVEFYDVRAAEVALRALNKSDIAGKRIKLEPSRPGGARRCGVQQFSLEMENEESSACQQQGSSPNNSPPGGFGGSISHESITSIYMENGSVVGVPSSPFLENEFHHALSPSIPQSLPSPSIVGSSMNQTGLSEPKYALGQMEFGFQRMPSYHPHSLPDFHHNGLASSLPFSSPGTITSGAVNIRPIPLEGTDNRHLHRVGSNGHSFDVNEVGNGNCPLHGHQYMWNSSNSFHPHPPSPMMWPNSPSFVNGIQTHPSQQLHGLPRAPSSHMLNTVLPIHHHHHHVGSAPAVNPSLWERRHGYGGETHDASGFHPGSLGSNGFSGNTALHHLEFSPHNIYPRVGSNSVDPSNPGLHSPQQRCDIFPGRNPMISMPNSFDYTLIERVRNRRNDVGSSTTDNKSSMNSILTG